MASRIAVLLASSIAIVLSACGNDPRPLLPDAPVCTTPGTISYLAICTGDSTCASCLCHNFGHASLCTQTCSRNEDCPAPAISCRDNVCQPF